MITNDICEILSSNKAILHVKPFSLNGVTAIEQNIDLTPWQGKTVRLYAETDGSISTNQGCEHYWLLLEAAIPEQTTSISIDTEGNVVQNIDPLDLTTVQFTIFDLPQEG